MWVRVLSRLAEPSVCKSSRVFSVAVLVPICPNVAQGDLSTWCCASPVSVSASV